MAIARLREQSGDLRATVRALREAVTRDPTFAAAHGKLGELLCEGGRVEEGLRHLERASRLAPRSAQFHTAKAHALVPFGDSPQLRAALAAAHAIGGPTAAVYAELRACAIWGDAALSASLADRIEAGAAEVSYRSITPWLRAIAAGSGEPSLESRAPVRRRRLRRPPPVRRRSRVESTAGADAQAQLRASPRGVPSWGF